MTPGWLATRLYVYNVFVFAVYATAVDVRRSMARIVAVSADPKVLLGKRVREIRESQGISQEALADIAGVHRTYMGTVERGETNISLLNVIKIAKALKVRPSMLLDTIKN